MNDTKADVDRVLWLAKLAARGRVIDAGLVLDRVTLPILEIGVDVGLTAYKERLAAALARAETGKDDQHFDCGVTKCRCQRKGYNAALKRVKQELEAD